MTRPVMAALVAAGALMGAVALGGCASGGSAYGSGDASGFRFTVNFDDGRKNWLAAAGDGKLVVHGAGRILVVEHFPPKAHLEVAWRGGDELEIQIVREGAKPVTLVWHGMLVEYAHRGLSVEKAGTYTIEAEDGKLVRFEPWVPPKVD